jgi:hypothetical protein
MKTMITTSEKSWEKVNFQNFWAEIAPREHLVQVYESEKIFLNTLEGFVGSGLLAGDTVIIIGTEEHLKSLNERLEKQMLNIKSLVKKGQYIPLDARKTLSRFMVKGWPDEKLFLKTIDELFSKAKRTGNRIRAFGEMVAILWEEGNCAATVHLEHLWNKVCEREDFCLYCAYPKSGFTKDPAESIKQICCTHSKVISGKNTVSTEIYFKDGNA